MPGGVPSVQFRSAVSLRKLLGRLCLRGSRKRSLELRCLLSRMRRGWPERVPRVQQWPVRISLRQRCRPLQRDVHILELGSRQLRRMWQRLRRTQSVLLPGSLQHLHAELSGGMVRRRWLWRGMRLPRWIQLRRGRFEHVRRRWLRVPVCPLRRRVH